MMTNNRFNSITVKSLVLAITVSVGSMSFGERQTGYGYNSLGQVTSVDGPRTNVTDVSTFEYDLATANLLWTTNAAGHTTSYSNYTNGGLAQTITTPNGAVINVQYTWDGKVTQQDVISTDGTQTTIYGYDVTGNLVSVQTPNGSTLSYEYDGAQRLTAMSNSDGERIEYTLDSAGNITAQDIKDSGANIVRQHTQVFDDLSRLRQHVGGTDSQTTHLDYDADSRNTGVTDPKNNPETQNSYDALNRLTQVVNSANGTTTMTYNDHGLIETVTDPRGLVTTYGYSGYGELESITSPDTGVTTFTHDEAGNVTSRTNANTTVVNYSYDALNRLTEQNYLADASKNILFSYDDTGTGINGNPNYGLGQLTQITYFGGQIDYQYDQLGRLVAEQRSFGGQAYTTQYGFNAIGQLTQLSYPSGRLVNYSYDTQGRLSALTTQESTGATIQSVVGNLQYKPFGPATGFDYGNGIVQSYSYDLDYRLTDIVSNVQDWVYQYDLNSNIESITHNNDVTHNQTYGYDELNRLTTASGPYGDYSYSYDEVGNRTQRQKATLTETTVEDLTYAADANQLDQQVTSVDTVQTDSRLFTYSASGQLITDINNDRTIDFSYDENDRLSQVDIFEAQNTEATYEYNPLGQRVTKNYDGDIQHIHYDSSGQRIAESDANGNVIREYIYLGQQAIAMITGSTQTVMYQTDSEEDTSTQSGIWTESTQGIFNGASFFVSETMVVEGDPIVLDDVHLKANNWSFWDDGSNYVGSGYKVPTFDSGPSPYSLETNGSGSVPSDPHPYVTWDNLPEGKFKIYESHPTDTKFNFYSATLHELFDGAVSTIFNVDQTSNGGVWNYLGDFDLLSNSSFKVYRTSGADVVADAIKLVQLEKIESSISWTIRTSSTDFYNVEVYIPFNQDGSNFTTYELSHKNGNDSIQLNQFEKRGKWVSLGEYEFKKNSNYSLDLTTVGSDGRVYADAVRLSQGVELASFYFVHNDHLGTPKILTDDQGSVVWEIHTTPFGEVHQEIAQGLTNIKAFPGQYTDSETGLSYNYYRDYDPTTGRYIQSDPIGLNGGLNTYGYVEGNPVRLIDPRGLKFMSEASAGGGGAAGASALGLATGLYIGLGGDVNDLTSIYYNEIIPGPWEGSEEAANSAENEGDYCPPDKGYDPNEPEDCQAQFQNDTEFCENFKGGAYIACFAWAADNLTNCKKGEPWKRFYL